jgi:hypothetical protein
MDGPYDDRRTVEADLRAALAHAHENMEATGAHERLVVSTCLNADVELGSYDLMAIRWLAVADPRILQSFRAMILRAFRSGCEQTSEIKALRARNRRVPGEVFH